LRLTSTPNFRFIFSTATSMWICPIPERIISLVCSSLRKFSVGSSSVRRWIEETILSSSPLDFGSMAKDMIGGGISSLSNRMGAFSLQIVSPVAVSFNFARTAISPGTRISAGFWFFPSRKKALLKRSVSFRLALYMLPSELRVPE